MSRNKFNRGFLFFLLLIFTLNFCVNINSSEAFPIWETETLGPNSAVVFNMRGLTAGMTIEVQYNVISGPGGVDAYLVEGAHSGLLITKPSSYIIYEDNSVSDSWVYQVSVDNDYSVQFFNDYNQDMRLRFLVQTTRTKNLNLMS